MRSVVALLFVLLFAAPAAAAEFFVAPSGSDSNPGSQAAPFASFQKGLEAVQNGDTLTIRAGTYRLTDNPGSTKLYRPDATPSSHVTIRAYPGEKVTFLGSRSTEGKTWEARSGGLYRLDASFLPNDPTGLFTGDTRIEHVMKTVSGTRSHADIVDLKNPGEWTKADDSGAGCSKDNAGCYIYMLPPAGMDPNQKVFELSQQHFIYALGTSYLEIRGLEILYTQNTAISIEGGQGQLIENNVLGHNSNGNDNSYSIFVSYGAGVTIRNNRAFDSKYWGGFSNSKGITLMDMDPTDPSLVEGNEVYDIVGQGITTKDGVANVVVRGNYVHDVGVCVQPASRRCHWKKPNCATSDPENYPGGGWTIKENALVRCGVGVGFASGDQNENNRIFNNVFFDCDSGVDVTLAHPGTLIANNIFTGNTRGVFLDHGASGSKATFADFLPVFTAHDNDFSGNDNDYLLRPDWTGPGGSGTGYTVVDVQSSNAIEDGSISGDPLFVDAAKADFHLQDGSPAKGAGDGSLYKVAAVDMGRYPLGDMSGGSGAGGAPAAGGAPGAGGVSGAAGSTAALDPGTGTGGADSGCGCRTARTRDGSPLSWLALLAGLVIAYRRRCYAAPCGRIE
jgi:MYXO-CTERM domain-containing protein